MMFISKNTDQCINCPAREVGPLLLRPTSRTEDSIKNMISVDDDSAYDDDAIPVQENTRVTKSVFGGGLFTVGLY